MIETDVVKAPMEAALTTIQKNQKQNSRLFSPPNSVDKFF